MCPSVPPWPPSPPWWPPPSGGGTYDGGAAPRQLAREDRRPQDVGGWSRVDGRLSPTFTSETKASSVRRARQRRRARVAPGPRRRLRSRGSSAIVVVPGRVAHEHVTCRRPARASPGSPRLSAVLANATRRPSDGAIARDRWRGRCRSPHGPGGAVARLTSSVLLADRLRTNTCGMPTPPARFVAEETNATCAPSAEITGCVELPFAGCVSGAARRGPRDVREQRERRLDQRDIHVRVDVAVVEEQVVGVGGERDPAPVGRNRGVERGARPPARPMPGRLTSVERAGRRGRG